MSKTLIITFADESECDEVLEKIHEMEDEGSFEEGISILIEDE